MKKFLPVPLLLGAGLGALPATSLAQDKSVGVGIQAGTTGAGVVIALPLSESLSLRGSYNVFSYDTDLDSDDLNYDAELDKDSFGLLLDWHAFGGSFRFTGGAYAHDENRLSAIATPLANDTYEINGTVYQASDLGSVEGSVSFEKTTPYFGVGWGHATGSGGLTFMVDLGVQFQDSPRATLTTRDCQLSPAQCTQLAADLQAEADSVEDDGEDFELWPVVNISLLYRF